MIKTNIQAIILAGGKGTRLKPYTITFPKPLMPIGDTPILEIIIKQLKYYGINDIIMAVGYLSELIKAYFNNGDKWDLNISYSVEEKPLGTAAPIKLINNLNENFLVMNGDVLTNIDYKEFFKYHLANNALCTIATYKKPVKIDLGVMEMNDHFELTNYFEKPTLDYKVSMGIYAFKKEILNYIPRKSYFDFPDLIKAIIKNKKKVIGFQFDGYWLDIGRQIDYELAINEFRNKKDEFLK